MRARYMHVTGPMLRKVAQQVGDALWEPPEDQLRRKLRRTTTKGPDRERSGPFDIVPGEALAEDTRFELVRGCPQHAFQMFVRGFGGARGVLTCGAAAGSTTFGHRRTGLSATATATAPTARVVIPGQNLPK